MADGSVVFSTELDSSGLKNGLSKLGGTSAKWASASVKGIGIALGAVTTGLAAVAKTAITYNSQMENYTTNFGVMLGSQASAIEHVAELREMAAKTPFGMEDLANASQTMLSFGVNAEDSMTAMQQLGDISLGNKERFNSLSLAFSQVSAAGKLTGQDLLQMVNAGFNPLQTIAEKTGVNMADLKDVMAGGKGSKEFRKQMKEAQKEVKKMGDQASEGAKMLAQIGKDGAISAEMLGWAMEIETSPGGRFYEGMLKASETFSGMMSTLQDDATALVGKVFEPMTESLTKNLLPLAQGYIDKLSKAFDEGGTDGLVAAVGEVLADATTKTAAALPDVLSIASGILAKIATEFTNNADTIASGLSDAVATIATSGLPEAALTSIATLAGSLIKSLSSSLSENAGDIVGGISEGLVALASSGTLADSIGSLFGLASALVGAIGDELPELLPELASSIVDGIGTAFANLPSALSAGKKLLEGLKKGLVGEDGAGGAVGTLAQGIIDGIEKFFATHFPALKLDLPEWEDIVGWAKDLKNKIQEFFTIKVTLGPEEEGVQQSDFDQTWQQQDLLESDYLWGPPDFSEDATANAEVNKAAGRKMVQDLVTGMQEAATGIDSMSQEIGTRIYRGAVGAGSKIRPEGTGAEAATAEGEGEGEANPLAMQILQSVAMGIDANAGLIRTSVQNAMNNAETGVDVSGFNSVGLQISYGIAAGIRAGTSAVAAAVQAVVAAALEAAERAADINSPSRLFRDRIGASISEGVAVGVQNDAYLVRKAVNEMVLDSMPNMRSIGARASSVVNGAYDGNSALLAARSGPFNQTNNFNVPVQTPDEFATTMHMYATYGLEGAR